MCSAGCVINDYADQDIDPMVERTRSRPMAAKRISSREALSLFVVLSLIAALLLLSLPSAVWAWAPLAMLLTVFYPFTKRFFHAPQLVLGMAFSVSIPMAYAALNHSLDLAVALLVLANLCWVVMYDTEYAMSDREDDLKVGVKSTAILFGRFDRAIIALLQLAVLVLWLCIIHLESINSGAYFGLALAAICFAYQQWLIADRDRQRCFQAFLNNGWLGGFIWFGLIGL